MKKQASFIFSPDQLNYEFSETHPFNQKRIVLTKDLLDIMNTIDPDEIVVPRTATDEELLLAHDAKYIEIVKKASKGEVSENIGSIYGIGTEDTPFFPGMHEASALLVGGTLTAIEEVMEGRSKYALNLGGGLHHGFQGKASGFCIYNDSSVAIKYLQQKYGARVLYVDTDAHHGDGVQWTFYDDPNVCTFSIHETGRYLFPGTGNVTERGNGAGYGTSFNFPVDAFTEDESFLHIYKTALREVAEYFKPDVILTQNGADAHLYSTMKIYEEIPKLAKEIADEFCDGKWIAIGGGGYDIWRVVPRAWSHLWFTMKDIPTPTGRLPQEWLDKWQPESPVELIETWEDPDDMYEPVPRKNDINEKNEQMLSRALHVIRKTK